MKGISTFILVLQQLWVYTRKVQFFSIQGLISDIKIIISLFIQFSDYNLVQEGPIISIQGLISDID